MPTINYGAVTVGDAIQGIRALIQQLQPSMLSTGFSVAWSSSITGGQGGFVLTYETAGPVVQVANVVTLATIEGGTLPLAYVARSFGFMVAQLYTGFSNSGPDVEEVNAQIAAASKQCVADLCGATVVTQGSYSWTPPTRSRPFLAVDCSVASQEYDVAVLISCAQDQTQIATANQPISGVYAPMLAGGGYMPVLNLSPGSSNPPQDIDISLNNGSAIFSISSGTFTQPGG